MTVIVVSILMHIISVLFLVCIYIHYTHTLLPEEIKMLVSISVSIVLVLYIYIICHAACSRYYSNPEGTNQTLSREDNLLHYNSHCSGG